MNRGELAELAEVTLQKQQACRLRLLVCCGTPCVAAGAEAVVASLRERLAALGNPQRVGDRCRETLLPGADFLRGRQIGAGYFLIIKAGAKPTKQRFLRRQQVSDGMAGNRPFPQIVRQILLVVSEGYLVKKRLRTEHLLELIAPFFATSPHDERADGDQAGFMRRQLLPGDAAFLAFGVKLRTQRNQVEIPLLRFGEQDEPAGGSALLPGDVDLTTEDRLNALFPAKLLKQRDAEHTVTPGDRQRGKAGASGLFDQFLNRNETLPDFKGRVDMQRNK